MSKIQTTTITKYIPITIMIILMLIFPINFTLANESEVPPLTSEAAVLIDSNTGEVLFEKNGSKQMYPASITKIVTAIIAIETQDLSDIVSVSREATYAEGTRVYLLENEEISLAQLLQGLMISSGNDAAIAIAEHIDGSVEEFAKRMTTFARTKVGVSNKTNFTNPHGLFDENHTTTAMDMAKISAYAMKNDTFRELVSTESVNWKGEGWETTLYNHHPLLRTNDDIIGIKNGYVSKSGYTLATASKIGDSEFISVTLNSPSKFIAMDDTTALFDFGFANFETQWVYFDDEPLLPNFIYPNKLPITTSKGERIQSSISADGYVFIKGSGQRLLDVITLDKRELIELPYFVLDTSIYSKNESTLSNTSYSKETSQSPFLVDWFIVTGFLFISMFQ